MRHKVLPGVEEEVRHKVLRARGGPSEAHELSPSLACAPCAMMPQPPRRGQRTVLAGSRATAAGDFFLLSQFLLFFYFWSFCAGRQSVRPNLAQQPGHSGKGTFPAFQLCLLL